MSRSRTVAPLLLLLSACATAAPPRVGDAAPAAGSARDTTDASLAASLAEIRQQTGVPALAAAVVTRDGIVASAAVGVRRTDEPALVTVADQFHLGSDTKAMTGLLVARLVERGVLRWDTTLAQAFPEWSATMDPAWRDVQVVALLRHRSGASALVSAAEASILEEAAAAGPVTAQRSTFARSILHLPPAYPPGERFLYSNAGYMLAGAVVEKLTGRSWEEEMRVEVFAPLGMSSCGFGPPATGTQRGQPFAHVVEGGTDGRYVPTDRDNPAMVGPAGTVHCSLEDWSKFIRANMEPPSPQVVSDGTLALLHEPVPMSYASNSDLAGYAVGWGVGDAAWSRGTFLTHTGSNGMNMAKASVAPRAGLAFLVVTNAGDARAGTATDKVLEVLRSRFAPSAPSAPSTVTAATGPAGAAATGRP